jgi:small subunit ribosomal protein S3
MDAGALGVEIVISGKLRTERARFEKFRAGYFPRVGDPALKNMKKAEVHVQLKPGILGVRVKIMPADVQFPDQIKIIDPIPSEETPIIEEKKIETLPESKVKIEEVPTEIVDTKAEVPKAEVPKAEVPKAEVPKAEVPKAEVPKKIVNIKKTSEDKKIKTSEKEEAKK